MPTDDSGFPTATTSAPNSAPVTRREFLHAAGALTMLAGMERLAPAYLRSSATGLASLPPVVPDVGKAAASSLAKSFDLLIRETEISVNNRRGKAVTINGTVPGPLLRLREGDDVTIRVTNALREDTSVHWHGILLPNAMDGVPGVTFAGIEPRQTFTYQFPIRQYGTYWYHSHSGLQEQLGHYGPLIIDPVEPEPFRYDREYVVMLSDWTFENPYTVLDKLKKQSSYFNYQRRTMADFFSDVKKLGWRATVEDRKAWGRMRMSPSDISDVTGSTYTYLMNGKAPATNWTGLFRPGERVRLRFINSGAGSYFDVRIPGLEMTVVQVSGQNVQPVVTDEFRIAIAETYDVIVQPRDDRAYTVFAESVDRSGYARGTLAPRAGMSAPIPARRHRPLLTMADMGMAMGGMGSMGGMGGMPGMDMPGMDMPGMKMPAPAKKPVPPADSTKGGMKDMKGMAGMDGMEGMKDMPGMPGMKAPAQPVTKPAAKPAAEPAMSGMAGMPGMAAAPAPAPAPAPVGKNGLRAPGTLEQPVEHSSDTHGDGNSVVPMSTRSRLGEPGPGLGNDGWRVLVYTDLRALEPSADALRPPEREIELHLTGNMERYMWSINGVKYSDAQPIPVKLGERLRITLVNDTMMEHPMHLHGMWMQLENGQGAATPRVHTISVKPADRVSVLVTADAVGPWAFHCHVLYHMEVGMFRVVQVSESGGVKGAEQ